MVPSIEKFTRMNRLTECRLTRNIRAVLKDGVFVYKDFSSEEKEVCREIKRRILPDVDFEAYVTNDIKLQSDGFFIETRYDGTVDIRADGVRGFKYALAELSGLLNGKDILSGIFSHNPSFEVRGIIEGFYGSPYTAKIHKKAAEFLEFNRMNSYFYAPKNDVCHRDNWREPYTDEKFLELQEFIFECNERQIDFCYCISVGKDYRYTDEQDFDALCVKLIKMYEAGAKGFGLLMDDIEPRLSENDRKKFSSAAQAHSALANRVSEFLGKYAHGAPLYFCPTDYMQITDTPYRKEIRDSLNKNIKVFWTGYNTVAEKISAEDSLKAVGFFDRKPVLWDNYPVNDFALERMFMGPIVNRCPAVSLYHSGYVANLSDNFIMSEIPLATAADYAWNANAYDENLSFLSAVKTFAGDQLFEAALTFAKAYSSSVLRLSESDLEIKRCLELGRPFLLKDYFGKLSFAVSVLREKGSDEFLSAAQPWLEYCENECALFNNPSLSAAEKCLKKGTLASKFLAQYVLGKEISDGFDREDYWKIQQENEKRNQ